MPLPPIREDPSIQAGYAAQQAYGARLNEIDADTTLDELGRAEAIVAAYEEHLTTVQTLAEDLHTRRVARAQHLAGQIPTGPGIPDDATPADRAVFATAFRSSLAQARAAGLEERQQMLADAIKYGDDVLMRAVLSVADEKGEAKVFDQWAKATGKGDLLAELRALNEEIHGAGPSRAWVGQALRAPRPPRNEMSSLPVLRQRAEQSAREAEQARRLATPAYRRY